MLINSIIPNENGLKSTGNNKIINNASYCIFNEMKHYYQVIARMRRMPHVGRLRVECHMPGDMPNTRLETCDLRPGAYLRQ